ncbi:MAG: histidine kinase dimerization/phosphoacceptor domain -containing protein [Scytonema sp. PMC 1069.18]|nr:histidine kinase dimerization/phosphoacceptor domain -containing protein [Scytonema sp. PMC 1069.18]MEC4881868.1 histidine kinase dimerization/phosphoacceptor domain -containing protein [Scytonema sp. PMC 1070.18]
MAEFFQNFLSQDFIPHGHCYLWFPGLVWLHLLSDLLITLAYYSIPIMLVYFVSTRPDVPFAWIFWMFSTFIIACGTSHFMEVWTLWYPTYWVSGLIKAITAFISVFTAIQLVPLIPKALALPSPAQLEAANLALQKVRDELEIRVRERTADLGEINKSLQVEITERKRIEEILREREEQFRLIAYTAPVMIWSCNTDGLCNYFNKVWLEFTGRTIQQELGNGWLESVYSEDREQRYLSYIKAFNTCQKFSIEYRLKRFDGEYRWILDTGVPHYTEDGRFAGYIGSCVDITERKYAEEQIQVSLVEKEVLLKEIYHRVKNNLQVISSLLHLQEEYIKDKDDLEIFQQSQLRIESMALIHQKLYQSQDLAKIDVNEYICDLVKSLCSSYEINSNVISLTANVDNILLNLDTAIPCGLIITELVSNSLKYAFPHGRKGEVCVELKAGNDNVYTLTIRDNGVGFPAGFNFQETTSLGLQLVEALTNQISGNLTVNSSHNGVEVKMTFFTGEKNNWRAL